jgi:hypothetical protein
MIKELLLVAYYIARSILEWMLLFWVIRLIMNR